MSTRGVFASTTDCMCLLLGPFLESWPGGFAKWLGHVLALAIHDLVSVTGHKSACAKRTMPLPLP